jgi:hypothetical protein
MTHYLIYISTAEHLMAEHELAGILEQSRDWNLKHGITGMLIYIEGLFVHTEGRTVSSKVTGRFMQVLEGSKQDIEDLFENIASDGRHHSLMILDQASIPSRNFESWQMGFTSLTVEQFKATPGHFNLDDTFLNSSASDVANLPLHFLKSFYQRSKS